MAKKGEPRPPGAGRKRGTPNRVTTGAKLAMLAVYDGLGGDRAFELWAEKNPSEFYKLFARLIPTEHQVSGHEGGPIRVMFGGRYQRTNGHA